MTYIHEGMQGKVGEAKHKNGVIHDILVYRNSSDFPGYHIIVLSRMSETALTERVPITEEIWQRIGTCLGYKFRKAKELNVV